MAKSELVRKRIRDIMVIGLGYVGLPLALILAEKGFRVTGVDKNERIVGNANQGRTLFAEEEISRRLRLPAVKRNFSASRVPGRADVFIICVPTPLESRRKVVDLSNLLSSIGSVAPFLVRENLVLIESTIPPLTCREVVKPFIESRTHFRVGTDLLLAHSPERILPGNTFYELVHNNRVIGGINKRSAFEAKRVYESFVEGDIDLVDDVTAETVKLMENTYRDVNIALGNEFAIIASGLGIDVKKAIQLANKHPRVKILSPGIGVGGHCLPKDPWLLAQASPEEAQLITTARRINESMPKVTAAKIRQVLSGISDPKIVTLGMTYKPDSDDLRGSPALEVVKLLKGDGYDVSAYDKYVVDRGYDSINNIARNADAVVVLVEHSNIRNELARSESEVKSVMRTPIILHVGTDYKPDEYDRSQIAASRRLSLKA